MDKQKDIIINYLIEEKTKEFTPEELSLNSMSLLKADLYNYYINDKEISDKIDNTILLSKDFFSILDSLKSDDFSMEFMSEDVMVFNGIYEYSKIYLEKELRIFHYDKGFRLKININEDSGDNFIKCLFTVDNKDKILNNLNDVISKVPSYFNYLCNIYKEDILFCNKIAEQLVSIEKKLKNTSFKFLDSDLRTDVQGVFSGNFNLEKIIEDVKEILPLTSLVSDVEINEEFNILSSFLLEKNNKRKTLKI